MGGGCLVCSAILPHHGAGGGGASEGAVLIQDAIGKLDAIAVRVDAEVEAPDAHGEKLIIGAAAEGGGIHAQVEEVVKSGGGLEAHQRKGVECFAIIP